MYVKKQNCRIWSENNPQAIIDTTLHYKDAAVQWCALWTERAIGTYFFNNEAGLNAAVLGERLEP